MLGSPVVQEAISRVSSFISSKREEEASREHNIERLEMASTELELAIERSGKLPITDVSLLRRRKILKRALEECSDILHRCKQRALQDQETEQGRTFMLAAECAIGELTLLPDLHDISHSYGAPWLGIQDSYTRLTRICRPDPTCCGSNGHESCPDNTVSSELSSKTGEQVISVNFQYYTSAQEHNFQSSIDEQGRNALIDWSPPLKVTAGYVPHGMWEDLARNYELEVDERRDENIEQVIEMVRWKTMDRLIRQPGLPYMTLWQYAHGFAVFQVRNALKPYRPHHDEDRGHDLERCKRRRRAAAAAGPATGGVGTTAVAAIDVLGEVKWPACVGVGASVSSSTVRRVAAQSPPPVAVPPPWLVRGRSGGDGEAMPRCLAEATSVYRAAPR
ncbi:hypothetical protein C2845_PM04G20490 [Panicum miliaceum]|uniref:Uncharacterized protein n=1 Tax=Panicum miliaceum TaxID=4540 RepID=A0A3L6QNC0_PANMI|nr:hypothetical protein C2845_PM04G20490 [Panicum miliaceum]